MKRKQVAAFLAGYAAAAALARAMGPEAAVEEFDSLLADFGVPIAAVLEATGRFTDALRVKNDARTRKFDGRA